MLDGTYRISLNTPMGPIKGNISLVTNDTLVQGTLETMGMKNSFNGKKITDDKCNFSGNLNTPLGNISYNAICTVVRK